MASKQKELAEIEQRLRDIATGANHGMPIDPDPEEGFPFTFTEEMGMEAFAYFVKGVLSGWHWLPAVGVPDDRDRWTIYPYHLAYFSDYERLADWVRRHATEAPNE